MSRAEVRCLIGADFTSTSFGAILQNDHEYPTLSVEEAPFDQVRPTLFSIAQGASSDPHDIVVIWTRPDAAIPSFKRLVFGERTSIDEALQDVDEYADLLLAAARNVRFVFAPTWCLPPYWRGQGLVNFRTEDGWGYVLSRMNLRLCERLSEAPNAYALDTSRWLMTVGDKAIQPKQWYLGKVAFSQDVFKLATRDIKAGLRCLYGGTRKLVIVDLDDTMWGGTVGDVGLSGVVLGGHDAIGEAYVDFQRHLKRLVRQGIMLGIVSKNEEGVALEILSQHPEMELRPDDFVGWKINWEDKAQNIVELVAELNIGLQSVVFIDNNPFERGRVMEALPEVLVPDWPSSPMLYVKALNSLDCFDQAEVTDEDARRLEMYNQEQQRRSARSATISLEDWLKSLNLHIEVDEIHDNNIVRVVQLLNKTNQMNLRTRRVDENSLRSWLRDGERHFWTFRVKDRMGDSGLTALLSVEVQAAQAVIIDFVASCRVFDRGVEESMLHHAIDFLRSRGVEILKAEYLETEKNRPCLNFWRDRSGFRIEQGCQNPTFSWSFDRPYAPPAYVTIDRMTSGPDEQVVDIDERSATSFSQP